MTEVASSRAPLSHAGAVRHDGDALRLSMGTPRFLAPKPVRPKNAIDLAREKSVLLSEDNGSETKKSDEKKGDNGEKKSDHESIGAREKKR